MRIGAPAPKSAWRTRLIAGKRTAKCRRRAAIARVIRSLPGLRGMMRLPPSNRLASVASASPSGAGCATPVRWRARLPVRARSAPPLRWAAASAGLRCHKIGRARIGDDLMAESFQHRGDNSAESRGRHRMQGFELGDNRVREAGDFLSAQLGGGNLEAHASLIARRAAPVDRVGAT
jgi:hypothetical protein